MAYEEELADFQPQYRQIMANSLDAMAVLTKEIEADAAKIPEDIFVDYLLPVLTNRSGNQSLARWQLVAGHVMRPLDVYDVRTKEILFRVPAILRSINSSFGNAPKSVARIMDTVEQKRRVIPALGDKYIQTQLVEKMQHVDVNASEVIAWNEILKRYGYPPILNIDTTPLVEEQIAAANDDLEVEGFDDF